MFSNRRQVELGPHYLADGWGWPSHWAVETFRRRLGYFVSGITDEIYQAAPEWPHRPPWPGQRLMPLAAFIDEYVTAPTGGGAMRSGGPRTARL